MYQVLGQTQVSGQEVVEMQPCPRSLHPHWEASLFTFHYLIEVTVGILESGLRIEGTVRVFNREGLRDGRTQENGFEVVAVQLESEH